jgi:hypothetical protein
MGARVKPEQAKLGTQVTYANVPRRLGSNGASVSTEGLDWMPAFAGMTMLGAFSFLTLFLLCARLPSIPTREGALSGPPGTCVGRERRPRRSGPARLLEVRREAVPAVPGVPVATPPALGPERPWRAEKVWSGRPSDAVWERR